MAKQTFPMVVQSGEVWGRNGKVIESLHLGVSSDDSVMEYSDAPTPSPSMSLYFDQGEGLSKFPVGAAVNVTVETAD
ncbi:MAG TPA: hypothetical protein VGM37_02510 [Armatimonadota bacterium]|jgi:hypothetical protein